MKIILLFLFFINLNSHAGVITNIVQIEMPEDNSENIEVLVSFEGRVFNLDPLKVDVLRELQIAKEENLQVNLEFGEALKESGSPEYIIRAEVLENNKSDTQTQLEFLTPMTNYEPSNVTSLELAQEMFDSLYKRTKWFTQCFNRAHIWSKQMHDNYGVKSMKILIYYTKKYRKEVSKKWWFHIAPMISVNGEYYVMDKEFTRAPLEDELWEKIFTSKINNPAYRCLKIDNISEYYDPNNMANEYCNIQHTSMYYWEPNDMSRLQRTGEQKTQWIDWEIRSAAREVYWDWRNIYRRHRVQN